MSLPKIFLNYNEKINRFYYYKLNTSYYVNNRYLECINPYVNDISNFTLTNESFGLFGLDTRIEKKVNDITLYNSNPDITWENRWSGNGQRTVYFPNPKNMFSKMLGFTTKYNYECNKFQFNEFDIEVVYSEYIGTNAEYHGFRFITKFGDEFILKYEDDNPRLFLISTTLSAKNIPVLPILLDTVSNQFINNSGIVPGTTFLLNTIADKIYHSTSMEYVTYHVNPYLNNPATATTPAGATSALTDFGIIDNNCLSLQLPLEIKFSSSDTTNSTLNQLLNFTVSTLTNTEIIATSYAAMSLRTSESRDPYVQLGISPLNYPQGITDSFLNNGFGPFSAPFPTETLFPNTIEINVEGKYTNGWNWTAGNVATLKLHADNALTSVNIPPAASSLVNLIKISHPEYYQVGRFQLNKSSNILLFNQLKDALCLNDDNLGIMIEYVSNTNTLDINNIVIKLSNKNQPTQKTITVDLSDIDTVDAAVNINNIYVSSSGTVDPPITCSNNFTYNMSKNTNIVDYDINDNTITICFGYFLNDIYNRNDDYLGEIDTTSQKNVNGILRSKAFITYPNVSSNLLCINYTQIKDLCDANATQETYNSVLNVINNTTNICYPKTRYCQFIQGQLIGSNYEDYYRYRPNSDNFLYTGIGTTGSFQDKKLTDIYGSLNHYYISNTGFLKTTTPFIGDLFYVNTLYDSAVLSINFFIADSANCLVSPDYYLLDIEELNNKYSNNNEIEKHTFLEIPNNNSSLIYYESTNIGYSTKEFNPPLPKLDRLTIKIRDIYGNILEDNDSSKDFSLIMNIQEINNSSNATINN